ncbi:plasmid stabilization protein [Acinetobacter sp. 194]|nr:plasmid stabilization protein [Acinetobacter shaoyimingii]
MNNIIHSRFVASISDLKKNPMEVVNNGFGEAVAILNRSNTAFYCVPVDMDRRLMDLIEDKK